MGIGIVRRQFSDQELIEEPFAEDMMVVVASPDHHLARQVEEVKIEDLAKETWIVRESGSGTREVTDKLFSEFKLAPTKFMYFSSTQPIKESVEAGLGISLLSEWAIQKELRYGALKIINVKGIPLTRNFSIVTNSPYRTKAMEVFIEVLRLKTN